VAKPAFHQAGFLFPAPGTLEVQSLNVMTAGNLSRLWVSCTKLELANLQASLLTNRLTFYEAIHEPEVPGKEVVSISKTLKS
jgi:hypothetical protein